MVALKCEICGKEFIYEKETSCKVQLRNHLKKDHQIELEDYIVKYKHRGEHPICPCGCGKKLHLRKGGQSWEFNKYATDTCYGRMVKSNNQKNKFSIKNLK